MKFGLPISLALHAAIIGVGTVGLKVSAKPSDEYRIIPVKIYTVSDVTNVRAAIKAPEPVVKPELAQAPEPEPEPEIEPLPQSIAATEPVTEPAKPAAENPAVNIKPDDVKAPTPVTKADLKVDPKKPPEPEKPKPLSLDDLTAMVAQSRDKIDNTHTGDDQKLLASERNRIEQAALAREAQGLGTGMTSAYEDAIMRRIYNAWRIPSGAPDLESLIVTLNVTLDRDGKVTSVSLTPESERRVRADNYYRTSAESALRAVRDAKEFKFLPRADYERWRDLTLTFHPKDAPTGVPT